MDSLLHDTTILNFPFILNLAWRYKKVTTSVALGFAAFLLILFYFQKNVYWSSVRFHDMNASTSVANALAQQFVPDFGTNKGSEILGLKSSFAFTEKVSDNLIAHKDFDRLRFDLNFFGNEKLVGKVLRTECNEDVQCLRQRLIKLMPEFYNIVDVDKNKQNYILEVKSLDHFTVETFVRILAQSITDSRVDLLQQNYLNEETRIAGLLSKAVFEIDNADALGKIQILNGFDEKLKSIETQMDHLGKVLVEKNSTLAGLESRVMKTNLLMNKTVDINEMNDLKKQKELRERVEKLTNDINALEIYSFQLNTHDKGILARLKEELGKSVSELKQFGGYRGVSNFDHFLKDNEMKMENNELEMKVVASQYDKTKEQFESLLLEKQKLQSEKLRLEEEYKMAKPSMDFIKGLETQLSQLKLLKQTVISNLRFDHFSESIETKRMSKLILVAYYFIGLFIMIVSLLSLSYLFDDNIYDEMDIEYLMKDVPVLNLGP